jgi:hypothetical protein
MRLRPLPSLTDIVAFLASMVIVVIVSIGAPGNWALGMLVGIALGLLLVAQGRRYMARHQEWFTSTYLPSRRKKDYHDLAMRIQNGDVPERVERIINAANLVSAFILIIAFLWLLLPAIFSRNMAGWEVTMRGTSAGMFAAISAPTYWLSGSASDESKLRMRRIAGGAIALLCFLAWHYHSAAGGL